MKYLLLLLIASAPLFALDNAWIESGSMIRYPASHFFYAIGTGPSPEAAATNAIVEVRKQLSSTVDTRQMLHEKDVTDGQSFAYSSTFEAQTTLSIRGDIQGVNIVASAQKGGLHYAFAVLEKSRFAQNTKGRIHEMIAEVETLFEKAKREINSGSIVEGLQTVNTLRSAFERLEATRTLYTAVAQLTADERLPVSLNDINSLYLATLSSLQTSKAGGDRQEIAAGTIPEEPFQVQIGSQGFPVSGIPFVLTDERNRRLETGYSDGNGIVTFYPGAWAQTERGTHRYRVTPNISVDREHRSRIRQLEQEFRYTVISAPSKANISVSVSSNLSSAQKDISEAVLATLARFDIVDDECSCFPLHVSISSEPGEYVQGVSAARTFLRTQVRAVLTLKDREGQTVETITLSAEGLGRDLETSTQKGIENLNLRQQAGSIKDVLDTPEPEVLAGETPVKPTVIVFPFTSVEYIHGWQDISRALGSMVTTRLINSGGVTVLERDQISKLVDEQDFRGEDIDLARFAGADLAIFGTAAMRGGRVEVDARIVDVKTAVARGAASATGSNASELRSIADTLVKEMRIDGRDVVEKRSEKSCCR